MKVLAPYFAIGVLGVASSFSLAADVPPTDEIVRQVVAKDEANQKALQSMRYTETLHTERLDAQNHVMKRQEMTMIVRPGAKQEVEVIAAKGDDMPTDPDAAVRQAKGQAAQQQKMNFSLKDMTSRFNITYQGPSTFEGQAVYLMTFAPKPNQAYRDQTEKVLNQLHGRMWISTRDYSVLKTEASLAEPVNVAWIFASVNALTFTYELHDTTGAMGPSLIETSVDVKAPFFFLRQHTSVDLDQFQPREGVAAGITSAR